MTLPVGEWARRAATLPAVLVETTPRAVRAGAEPLEEQARSNLRRATGGDLRLSRVRSGRNGGTRVDVALRLTGSGTATRALVLPVGPVSLVEVDTRAHRQPFQYLAERTGGARSYSMTRRRKAVRSRVIRIPGVGIRTFVHHPGTRGRHPVGTAMTEAGARAGQTGGAVFLRAITEHLT